MLKTVNYLDLKPYLYNDNRINKTTKLTRSPNLLNEAIILVNRIENIRREKSNFRAVR